jgi:adenylate cyclase
MSVIPNRPVEMGATGLPRMDDDVRPVTDESHQHVEHMGHLEHTESDAEATEIWREILTGKVKGLTRTRKLIGWIPAGPRCKLCEAPMKPPGSVVLRPFGFGPSAYNRRLCRCCFKEINGRPGGAEIELSLLFADVRGSTGLAERMAAHEFSRLISRFYGAAGRVVENWNGLIDKFVGDEVVALFIPGFAGDDHASRAIGAARELMRETGNGGGEPWVPIGAGVHTGVAFVGSIGEGEDWDFTAVGDAVNTTARLASSAGAGEILVSRAAAQAAGLNGGLETRTLELRGRDESVDAVVARA